MGSSLAIFAGCMLGRLVCWMNIVLESRMDGSCFLLREGIYSLQLDLLSSVFFCSILYRTISLRGKICGVVR